MAALSAVHAKGWAHSPGPAAIAPNRAAALGPPRAAQQSCRLARPTVPPLPEPAPPAEIAFYSFSRGQLLFRSFLMTRPAQERLGAAGRRCGRRPAPLAARRSPAAADVSLRDGGGLGGDPAAGGRFPAGAVRRGSPQVSRAAPAPPAAPLPRSGCPLSPRPPVRAPRGARPGLAPLPVPVSVLEPRVPSGTPEHGQAQGSDRVCSHS